MSAAAAPISALQRSHAHLGAHRRMIVMRTLAAGAVGLLPLPWLDDYLATLVRRGTIARLAEAHRVDVQPAALDLLAGELPREHGGLGRRLSMRLIPRLLGRGLRKTLILVGAARRADETLDGFAAATLFDHYCARLHVGAAIDLTCARRLRAAIQIALRSSRSRTLSTLFRRAIATLGRALLRLPISVIERVAHNLKSRLTSAPLEAELVTEDTLAAATASGIFRRVTAAVEAALATIGVTYIDGVITLFESSWSQST